MVTAISSLDLAQPRHRDSMKIRLIAANLAGDVSFRLTDRIAEETVDCADTHFGGAEERMVCG
jgi:hypothetical protein